MITALMMVAAATVCAGANDATGQSIVNARAEFNRAIAERDIGAVSAALAENALLVTGTDSIRLAPPVAFSWSPEIGFGARPGRCNSRSC